MENIDWGSLGFNYMKTDFNARFTFTDGKWSEMEITSDEYIKMHMAATCLHYGQEAFEGLKAYRCPDGKVRVFRMDENAARCKAHAAEYSCPRCPPSCSRRWLPRLYASIRTTSRLTKAEQRFTYVRFCWGMIGAGWSASGFKNTCS